MNSSFKLEKSPKKKGDCPTCQHKNTFRFYEGLPRTFGRCERINKCGAHIKPNQKELQEMGVELEKIQSIDQDTQKEKIVYPTEVQLKCAEYLNTPFHIFCREKLKISDDHFKLWNVGGVDQVTKFIYKNAAGKVLNIVSLSYINSGNNVNRNKEKLPFSLKASKGEKFSLCLFGEHLLEIPFKQTPLMRVK